jgi:hypothetical protein
MITRPLPSLENDLHKQATVGRVFYATRQDNTDAEGFRRDGKYLVDIRTPYGDLKLWPYEYCVLEIADLMAMWQAGELTFHPKAVSTAQLDATVFYARSRGISMADAMAMALGTLQGDVGYFEPATEELSDACESMGEMIARAGVLTPENHARRKRAQERADGSIAT